MPIFNLPFGSSLTTAGAIVQAEISIPLADQKALLATGAPIPAAIHGHALIDTGASATAVHEPILRALGISPIDVITSNTPHGTGVSSIYPACIGLPSLQLPVLQFARVMGCNLDWLTPDGTRIIALLGRDLMQYVLMIYNSPAGTVSLSY